MIQNFFEILYILFSRKIPLYISIAWSNLFFLFK